jgi:DnaK suppressor protein
LSSRKAALRRDAPAQTLGVIDDEEHSMDAEELGIGAAVLQLTSQTVQGIESALRRVEAGAYGTCSDCASRISSARLRALPFADRCRACQETQDTAAPPMQGHAIAQQGWR